MLEKILIQIFNNNANPDIVCKLVGAIKQLEDGLNEYKTGCSDTIAKLIKNQEYEKIQQLIDDCKLIDTEADDLKKLYDNVDPAIIEKAVNYPRLSKSAASQKEASAAKPAAASPAPAPSPAPTAETKKAAEKPITKAALDNISDDDDIDALTEALVEQAAAAVKAESKASTAVIKKAAPPAKKKEVYILLNGDRCLDCGEIMTQYSIVYHTSAGKDKYVNTYKCSKCNKFYISQKNYETSKIGLDCIDAEFIEVPDQENIPEIKNKPIKKTISKAYVDKKADLTPKCKFSGCEEAAVYNGYCWQHYGSANS